MQHTQRHARGRSWRPALYALALAIGLVLSGSAVRAQETQKCSDFTPDHRACTMMEEYGYCLTNAIESYDTCKGEGGIIWDIGCAIAFEVDYYACAASMPVKVITTVVK